jgi:phosphoribosylaminoimidazole (AIR) synthetase
MVVVVAARDAARAQKLLEKAGERVWRIGTVRRRRHGEPQTLVL